MKYGMRLYLVWDEEKDRDDLIKLINKYLKEHKPTEKNFQKWDAEEAVRLRSLGEEKVEEG